MNYSHSTIVEVVIYEKLNFDYNSSNQLVESMIQQNDSKDELYLIAPWGFVY